MVDLHCLLPKALLVLGVVALAVLQETAARPAARSDSPDLPKAVDLRPRFWEWGLGPRRQGARGTCSVFTMVGALEYAAAQRQGRGTYLSVEFLNWAGHKAVGREADGGFFSDLWKGYRAYGVCL